MTGYTLKRIRKALAAVLTAHRRTRSPLRDNELLCKAFRDCQNSAAQLTALQPDSGQDLSEQVNRLYRAVSKALAIVDDGSGRKSVLYERVKDLHYLAEEAAR